MGFYITTDGTNTNINTNCGGYYTSINLNREYYERELKQRQKEHLDNIQNHNNANWRPCLREQCPSCHGTGLKYDGCFCVHGISCPCPKCTPSY